VAVITIVVTGTANALRQVGSIEAARTTGYGRLLIIKLVVVVAMLVLGGCQRRGLTSIRFRAVATEALLAAIVLGLSTVLSSMVPARASVSRPISIRVQTDSTRSDITVDPARSGANVIHIYVFGLDGVTLPIDDANFELTHLATGTTLEVDPFKAGRGHEEARGVQVPLKGTWQIETRIYLSEFEVEQSTSTFEVR
jgi:Copper resistance protein D